MNKQHYSYLLLGILALLKRHKENDGDLFSGRMAVIIALCLVPFFIIFIIIGGGIGNGN